MVGDKELARRSILGFGEMIAAFGRFGTRAEIRRPDLLGAKIDLAAGNPWLDSAVVPLGAAPPADDPLLPTCVWTVASQVAGRREERDIAMPCLGLSLDDSTLDWTDVALDVASPSQAAVGDLNERAYEQFGVFSPLARSLNDRRIRTHGVRDQGTFVCVAFTFTLDDDLSIQFVATEASHRRRGLAGGLLGSLLAKARIDGLQSATLQASPEGLRVYERLGFHQVATLRGFLRPGEA